MESTKTVTETPTRYHTIVHFEIPANEPSKIARFYEQLFGWKFTKMEGGNMDYWLISRKDAKSPYETMGGLYKPEQGMSQQGILNYFSVKSIDESLKQASSLGATVVMPKQETGKGHFAILTDPNGNTFALFQGRM
jgi:predicted enzyme related to lactoylglutathione lyase